MQPNRKKARMEFLRSHRLESIEVQPFAADASFRQYFRLLDTTPAMLLMDAPPGQENVGPFVKLAAHLRAIGLRTPAIFACDLQNGFVLLEDFGDRTFTRLLQSAANSATESEIELYELATDVLIKLHHHPRAHQVEVAHYDPEMLVREAALFSQWYTPAVTRDDIDANADSHWQQIWHNCLMRLPDFTNTLVLRDFHVDNLMIVNTDDDRVPRSGQRGQQTDRCGLLDFQDAVTGSPAYDFVSLLEDARRDIKPDIQEHLKKYYAEHCSLIKDPAKAARFWRHYRILGAQRHAKVAGIFVRLSARDGKDTYLKHLPRVLRLFQNSISASSDEHDDFGEIREWISRYLGPRCDDSTALSTTRLPTPDGDSLRIQYSKNKA